MSEIKAIFFDNDGILVDTEPIWVQANLEIFHSLGFPVSRDWYLDYNMTQGKGLVQFLPEHGFSAEDIHKACTRRTKRYWELLPQVDAMPGVIEVLTVLKNKPLQMGIVTAAMRSDFERVHQALDLVSYFDFVITNEDTPQSKPAPDPYQLALVKTGLKPSEVLVIEDSPRGVKAAHAAGIEKIIAIPTEITVSGDFSLAWRQEVDIKKVLNLL